MKSTEYHGYMTPDEKAVWDLLDRAEDIMDEQADHGTRLLEIVAEQAAEIKQLKALLADIAALAAQAKGGAA